MRRAPQWLLSVSAVFLLTGCATTLRLSQEKTPAYLTELRAQYHSEFPQGPFREHVDRGEVVKGMDRFGVLASWGYPERRTRDGMVHERWVYVNTDESSGDTIEYMLAFSGGVLERWDTTRLTVGMTPVTRTTKRPETPATAVDPTGKDIPQN